MIINFREERLKDLESKLAKAQEESSTTPTQSDESDSLRKQLEDAQKEIEQWLEVADKNPQAIMLEAEKKELIAKNQTLQGELDVTPESQTARIRGLNELTNNLNAYLKEYCMSEGFDRLKEELESANQELTSKFEML